MVEWPGRRQDVVNGLAVLAADPPPLPDGADRRWPDLTNAVHWVVDDTWWDVRRPATDIGTILRDEQEATAVQEVVAAVVGVSERQGPDGTDRAWFDDEDWPRVRRLAGQALALLLGNDAAASPSP